MGTDLFFTKNVKKKISPLGILDTLCTLGILCALDTI